MFINTKSAKEVDQEAPEEEASPETGQGTRQTGGGGGKPETSTAGVPEMAAETAGNGGIPAPGRGKGAPGCGGVLAAAGGHRSATVPDRRGQKTPGAGGSGAFAAGTGQGTGRTGGNPEKTARGGDQKVGQGCSRIRCHDGEHERVPEQPATGESPQSPPTGDGNPSGGTALRVL